MNTLALSPDGTRVAFDRRSPRPNIWIYEFQRGISTQLTFTSAASDGFPVWSRDSSRIVFSSSRDGALSLYTKAANGAGKDELLFKSGASSVYAQDWSRDGRFLLYSLRGDAGGRGLDLGKLSLETKADGKIELKEKEELYLNTTAVESQGRFSPDGRFVAYAAGDGRMSDIYVQPFPDPQGQWKISEGGGSQPRWRGDGEEIYYVSPDSKMMAVEVSTTPDFKIGARKALFPVLIGSVRTSYEDRYDVTVDGKFLHCGTDHFDLVRVEGRWRILNITWNQRKEGCGR